MSRPFYVGFTGGIGSGKSSACKFFSELGAPVIDTDVIARKVVQPGHAALQEIIKTFGSEIAGEDGQLHRAHLREIVFNDDVARRKLEAIIHPRIHNEIEKQVKQITFPYLIICSALLVESLASHDIDHILVIDIPESLQMERASLRDNTSENEIRKIIESQIERQQRLDKADDVITNDKDLKDLEQQVHLLHKKYLEIASVRVTPCS
jgi:dephospho-CoA kinase